MSELKGAVSLLRQGKMTQPGPSGYRRSKRDFHDMPRHVATEDDGLRQRREKQCDSAREAK
jgi:hypothetical protein